MIYASFWPRALAILVDLAVLGPVLVVYFAVQGLSIPVAFVALLVMTVLGFAYHVYFLSRWGQTIGKMVTRIKVTRQDGSSIAARHAWLRSSVDIGLAAINLVTVSYVLATWTGPEWSSLNWLTRGVELGKRNPISSAYDWVSQTWLWSELVVLLLNKKRRALHDFIAGTVVVKVPASARRIRPSLSRRHRPCDAPAVLGNDVGSTSRRDLRRSADPGS